MMNQKLYCKVIGKGPPLVLLHGWGWHSGIWEPIAPYLSQYYQLFLIDLPGCGQSPLIFQDDKDYTCENLAAAFFEVVPAEATWLGWSLGGMLAWWIAIHFPRKVTRLITVATSPKFLSEKEWECRCVISHWMIKSRCMDVIA